MRTTRDDQAEARDFQRDCRLLVNLSSSDLGGGGIDNWPHRHRHRHLSVGQKYSGVKWSRRGCVAKPSNPGLSQTIIILVGFMAQTTPVQYVLDPALLSMGASTSYSSNQSQQQSYGDSGGYLPTMTPQSLLNANPPHESPDHRLELDESDRPVKRQRLDDLGSAPEPTNGEGGHYPPTDARLPPILQVEKQQVTTSATQQASTTRRKTDAQFVCPVPHCGSTFTRKFNLRGHLRSHTEERPFACDHPGCGKKFARSHDCKRHRALHLCKSAKNTCKGCNKMFSRQDALNRHLKSDGAIECKLATERSREVVEDDNTDDRDDLLQLDFHSHSRDFESPSRFLGDIGMGLDVGKL